MNLDRTVNPALVAGLASLAFSTGFAAMFIGLTGAGPAAALKTLLIAVAAAL